MQKKNAIDIVSAVSDWLSDTAYEAFGLEGRHDVTVTDEAHDTELSTVSFSLPAGDHFEIQVVRRAFPPRSAHQLMLDGKIPASACWGRTDEVDEIVSRARRPGGHLDVGNCQQLCTGVNRWKEDEPDKAKVLGLARNSWADRKDPDQ